ncbi:hypothetical protein HAX54_015476, partial [Datura stramonium]|nr:hypothetical protein [Datura stramonium]
VRVVHFRKSMNRVEEKAKQFQWVANMIAKGQPQWAISRGLIHRRDLKFEGPMWLDLVCVREVQANSVITLATKTDKDALVMKQAKCTGNRTPPPPSASSHTSAAPFHTAKFHTPTPLDLLNIARRAKIHERQLVQLGKDIPSMIQLAIKKALQPTKDKLKSLCSTVEVLEDEVGTLKKEVVALNASPSTN